MYLRVLLVAFCVAQSAIRAEPINFCRPPVDCYTCDSRVDDNCGDPFNVSLARSVKCHGRCFKVRHLHYPSGNRHIGNGSYFTTRDCLTDELKRNIEIYKAWASDVCYSTMGKDEGAMCLCDGSFCNAAPSRFVAITRIFFMNFCYACFIYLFLYLILQYS